MLTTLHLRKYPKLTMLAGGVGLAAVFTLPTACTARPAACGAIGFHQVSSGVAQIKATNASCATAGALAFAAQGQQGKPYGALDYLCASKAGTFVRAAYTCKEQPGPGTVTFKTSFW